MSESKKNEQQNIKYTPTAAKSYEMGERFLLQNSFDEAKMFFEECLGEDKSYCNAWMGLISAKLEDAGVFKYIVNGEGIAITDDGEDKISLSADDVIISAPRYVVNGFEKNRIDRCAEDIKNTVKYIADENTAERIAIFVCEVLKDIINSDTSCTVFLDLYKTATLLRRFTTVDELNSAIEKDIAKLFLSQPSCIDGIITVLLYAVDDKQKKASILNNVIPCYLSHDIKKARMWNQKLYDIDPKNASCISRKLLFACCMDDEGEQSCTLGDLKWKNFDLGVWKELLDACDDDERKSYIDGWSERCIHSVEKAAIGITSKSNFKACLAAFGKIISSMSLRYDKIEQMAAECLKHGFFDEAVKYYTVLLDDKTRNEHIARFGILLARFKCKSEQELLHCDGFNINCPEYKQLLISCGDDDTALKRYTDMAKRQKENVGNLAEYKPDSVAVASYRRHSLVQIVATFISAASLLFGLIAWIVLRDLMPYYVELVVTPFSLSLFFAVMAYVEYRRQKLSNAKDYKPIWVARCVAIAVIILSLPLFIASCIVSSTTKEYYGYKNGMYYNLLGNGIEIAECRDRDVTSVDIGKDVVSIGYYAFADCNKLTSITIPNGVMIIGDGAFSGCSSLTNIIIPDSVTSIGAYTFSGCSSLTSVTIHNRIASIGNIAFSDCSNLKTVYWNATACTTAGSSSSPIFKNCSNLTSLVVGENVLSIPPYAFYNCSGLTSITMTNKVKNIGGMAFSKCSSLVSVTVPDSVISIGFDAFSDCDNLQTVYWNATACEVAGSSSSPVFKNCNKLTSIVIGNNVTVIPSNAFRECDGLISVTIPIGVTSIGDRAFCHCDSLIRVFIPNGMANIGEYAFSDCDALTSITIPKSVEYIGYNAFDGDSLTIYAEVSSKPNSWNAYWNGGCDVVWNAVIW